MRPRAKINRRAFLRGTAGMTLALPVLEAMGKKVSEATPRRFCALYTANGMSLPHTKHGLDEWSWFPRAEKDGKFVFGKSTEAFEPFRDQLSFLGGLYHPNGPKSDPHVCSDMWLTGAPLQDPKREVYNSVALDQVVAKHTKQFCRQPSLVMSVDAGVGFLSRTGTISYSTTGKPIPAENDPRQIFNRLFRADRASMESQRNELRRRIKLVDAVLEQAKSLNQTLGKSDRDKMDQYLTSLSEVEERLVASEKWIDIPLKKQNQSHINLNAHSEGDPGEYYRTMFDLIALAFDADITRSIAFMLNREDGMGISDTFPIKLGINRTHHSLSHAKDKEGQLNFAKYDKFLTDQLVHFFKRLQGYKESNSNVLDNTLVLYGSGASTTHLPKNLPTMIAGGANMGLQHGQYWRNGETQMSNVFLSILRSLGVEEDNFADSTRTSAREIFSRA